jgi:hypothetical protein
MLKRANVIIKKAENKYIINPTNTIKGGGGIATEPYLIKFDLSNNQLLEKILYVLDLSTEDVTRPTDWKEFHKEYLKSMGVKTMKALHDGTINLSVYIKDDIINFLPMENKGSKEGFSGFKEDLTITLPFNSPKEELVKALELALSRCK